MPRVGMIGNRSVPARGDRRSLQLSTQTAEIRNLARQLNLLMDPEIAERALTDAIEQTPLFKRLCKDDGKLLLKKIETSLYRWRKRGIVDRKTFAIRMAQAVESAFLAVVTRKPTSSKSSAKKSLFGDHDRLSNRSEKDLMSVATIPNDSDLDFNPPQSQLITPARNDTSALVSDSEGGAWRVLQEEEVNDLDTQFAIADFWPNLVEATGLQVAARTTNVWGKKRVYEMYKLAGPCMPVCDLHQLRQDISKQLLQVFDENNQGSRLTSHSECRVFSVKQEDPTALWIQINIGRPFDARDHTFLADNVGVKKRKEGNEFIARIVPESSLVALTASRAASRSIYTPIIIFVLESVLTCGVAGGYAVGAQSRRVHKLSGTEPLDLFRTANAIEASDAVGRYAYYASQGSLTDPVTDLQNAANESLFVHNEKTFKNLQQCKQKKGLPEGVFEDQNVRSSRKRMRLDEFGEHEDCPVRQSLKWHWIGPVSAARTAWDDEQKKTNETFKCRLSMKGSDVFAGMQALLDAGILQGPLPHYMRDAPMLGGKIIVDHNVVKSNLTGNECS